MIVIECDEREITARCICAFELRCCAYLVRLAPVLQVLVTACIQRELCARPRALYQIQAFAADEPGSTKNADSHGASLIT